MLLAMGWALLFTEAAILLSSGVLGQTTSYTTTTSYGSTSSYYASSPSPTTFYTSSYTNTEWPAFPTVPYTGQSILVGTYAWFVTVLWDMADHSRCTLPQYTMLYFPDGGSLEAPLIGCSDDRPECCPGIVNSPPPASSTAATESREEEQSTTSWTATATSPTPTGVVSALSQNPLSICPRYSHDLSTEFL